MPAPVISAGTLGGLLNNVTLATGKNAAALLNLLTTGIGGNADIQGYVTCELVTGSTAPTAATVFACQPVYPASTTPPLTLSGSAASGALALPLNGSTNLEFLHQGQKVAVLSASTGVGEIVAMTASPSGTGAQSVACGTLTNSYSSGDHVFFINRTPFPSVSPSEITSQGWAANSDYSAEMQVSGGLYVLVATNTDTTAPSVVVAAMVDLEKGSQ